MPLIRPPLRILRWILAGLTAFSAPLSAQSQPPNIVVLVADDLGWADVGVGRTESFYETPHLDRLGKISLQYAQAYAACPVCSPSRYALFTGKHPVRGAATEWFGGQRVERFQGATYNPFMAPTEETVAERLQSAGYRTAFLGKWHLGPDQATWPKAQGFETNIGGYRAGHPKSWWAPYRNPRLKDGPDGEFLTERLTEEAVRLIQVEDPRPFLLWLSYYQVHTPLKAPHDAIEAFRAKRAQLPPVESEFAEEEQVWAVKKPRRVRTTQRHPTYAAMLQALDASVGRVLKTLEAQGLMDNTIILFTSDNGGLSTSEGSPTSNLPLRGGKGWMYEGGIRVPFMLRVPGRTADGVISQAPITGMDVAPTLASLAGLPALESGTADGRSLEPTFQGSEWPAARSLFWHYPHYANQGGFPSSAMRRGPYKYILRLEDGRGQLHHLEQDPGERKDLASTHPELADALRNDLIGWLREAEARVLRPQEGQDVQPWLLQ